jgi:hypothetical protein
MFATGTIITYENRQEYNTAKLEKYDNGGWLVITLADNGATIALNPNLNDIREANKFEKKLFAMLSIALTGKVTL